MQISQAKKLKDLERENARLKKLVAEQQFCNCLKRMVARSRMELPTRGFSVHHPTSNCTLQPPPPP